MKLTHWVQVDLEGHEEFSDYKTVKTTNGKMDIWYNDKGEVISVTIANPIRIEMKYKGGGNMEEEGKIKRLKEIIERMPDGDAVSEITLMDNGEIRLTVNRIVEIKDFQEIDGYQLVSISSDYDLEGGKWKGHLYYKEKKEILEEKEKAETKKKEIEKVKQALEKINDDKEIEDIEIDDEGILTFFITGSIGIEDYKEVAGYQLKTVSPWNEDELCLYYKKKEIE